MDEAPGSAERHDPLPAQPAVDCRGLVPDPESQPAQCAWVGGGYTHLSGRLGSQSLL
jgi:hypothetical protein